MLVICLLGPKLSAPSSTLSAVRNTNPRVSEHSDNLLSIYLKIPLTRRQQRILFKLFGGGSLCGDDSVETADLIQRGLVTQKGPKTSGLEVLRAALKSPYET